MIEILILLLILFSTYYFIFHFTHFVPNYQPKNILTNNEKEFFFRLRRSLPEYIVLTQVSFGAILKPNAARNDRKYYSIRGTFAQKIADFVVCDKFMNVIAIIELDDRTHNLYKDKRRDDMLNEAGYSVIRWDSRNKPSMNEIAETIAMISMKQD